MNDAIKRALEIEARLLDERQLASRALLKHRDEFAMAVLPALYADAIRVNEAEGFPNSNWRDGVASEAYRIADAMLAARNS